MRNLMRKLCVGLHVRLEQFKQEERGAVDIVAIVVMIGIAVLLAVLFRTQISSLLSSLFGTIEESAKDAITQ